MEVKKALEQKWKNEFEGRLPNGQKNEGERLMEKTLGDNFHELGSCLGKYILIGFSSWIHTYLS